MTYIKNLEFDQDNLRKKLHSLMMDSLKLFFYWEKVHRLVMFFCFVKKTIKWTTC